MKLTIFPLSNGLTATWQSETASHSMTVCPEMGHSGAWMLQQYFECSTMDGHELVWNARNRAMDWAMAQFAKFCNTEPYEEEVVAAVADRWHP